MRATTTMRRTPPDRAIADIAAYVDRFRATNDLAFEAAHYCLIDSLGCGFEALSYPACEKLLGPLVPGTIVPNGARVPGTSFALDPIQAAFNIGAIIRWLDYNDTFYGKTVIHPSDTFSGILAVADWISRTRVSQGKLPYLMRDVLHSAIIAYEIMGCLALENDFNGVGLDHTILVKIAVTAVTTKLLGGTSDEIIDAVSNALVDGHALVVFRRAPNTGSRKSWQAATASSRGVQLALMSIKGEMGYPSALTAKTWGFYDTLFEGKAFEFQRPYGSYVIENVQFKVAYPAAFHAHTAIEAAIKLHPVVKHRLDEIKNVELWTHKSCMIMLDKIGPLYNPADRDQCLQYTVAIALIFGNLTALDYEETPAANPRIDALRAKMMVREDKSYTRNYLNPAMRSNANSIRISFKDGTKTDRIEIEFPLGHPRRRDQGLPFLIEKFEKNVARRFAEKQRRRIRDVCLNRRSLGSMPVNEFVDMLVI